MAYQKKLTMVRGNTFAFGMDLIGINQDLDTVYFTCRKSERGDVVFQKSLGHGVEKVEDNQHIENYQYRIRIAPEDTEDLSPGTYQYDLEIGVNSDVYTLLRGTLTIVMDITR